ncbi:hypothetical protein OHU17_35140 [Streptomyces goshikiensis]|uniref:Uncharacterized protein n=1 Tax=Streptomyces goshikiensis TaxID=1942 RepID=A0ABZ1RUY2_9ACTN|nr:MULTISPECIES: hypothetical protein [Streptomyces]MBT1184886.1 hypothetical protein [Streptomyces sp. CJ_13]
MKLKPEGTFGIIDDGDVPIETVDWSRGMIAPMANGALVLTGINTGNVQVRVASDRTQQSSPDNEVWEENVSAHVWAPKGNLRIESLVHGPHPDLPLLSTAGPGWYEVEVKARGREANPDGSASILRVVPHRRSARHEQPAAGRVGHADAGRSCGGAAKAAATPGLVIFSASARATLGRHLHSRRARNTIMSRAC